MSRGVAEFSAHWQQVCERRGRPDLVSEVGKACRFLWGELEKSGTFDLAALAQGQGDLTFLEAHEAHLSYVGIIHNENYVLYSREPNQPWGEAQH